MLNFRRDASKMRYFSNKFSKITKRWRLLTFGFCDLELRDLPKLWFFELIMTKSNLKNQL